MDVIGIALVPFHRQDAGGTQGRDGLATTSNRISIVKFGDFARKIAQYWQMSGIEF
jgi:hypothetical protein